MRVRPHHANPLTPSLAQYLFTTITYYTIQPLSLTIVQTAIHPHLDPLFKTLQASITMTLVMQSDYTLYYVNKYAAITYRNYQNCICPSPLASKLYIIRFIYCYDNFMFNYLNTYDIYFIDFIIDNYLSINTATIILIKYLKHLTKVL